MKRSGDSATDKPSVTHLFDLDGRCSGLQEELDNLSVAVLGSIHDWKPTVLEVRKCKSNKTIPIGI